MKPPTAAPRPAYPSPAARRLLALLCLLAAAGSSAAAATPPTSSGGAARGLTRDWKRSPAIVEMNAPRDLYALGDVHGDYDRLVELLTAAKLISAAPAAAADVRWTGSSAVLVCTGDLIDKYDRSLPVIRLMRALQRQAAEAGGRVVVTLGNHEAEFLAAGGEDRKGTKFADELRAAGLSSGDVAAGRDGPGIGAWLRDLPAGAKAGDWFFCHAGNTGGLKLDELRDGLEKQIAGEGLSAPLLASPDSMLEARMHPRPWWEAGAEPNLHDLDDGAKHAKKHEKRGKQEVKDVAEPAGEARLRAQVEALGARHLVFGHQPGKVTFADGAVRQPGQMFEKFDGLVFLIDTGMSRGVDGGRGALLRVRQGPGGAGETATAVYADGKAESLWHN